MIQFKLIPVLFAACISALISYGIHILVREEIVYVFITFLMILLPLIGVIGFSSENERFIINSRAVAILFLFINMLLMFLLAWLDFQLSLTIIVSGLSLSFYTLIVFKLFQSKQ
jgi:hypothetical protein